MGECKWTPGPWVVDFGSVISQAQSLHKGRTHGYGCGNDFVADLNDGEYHEYTDRDEQDANANLIAAAPDLYKALEGMVREAELDRLGMWVGWGSLISKSSAALAKARGETE